MQQAKDDLHAPVADAVQRMIRNLVAAGMAGIVLQRDPPGRGITAGVDGGGGGGGIGHGGFLGHGEGM